MRVFCPGTGQVCERCGALTSVSGDAKGKHVHVVFRPDVLGIERIIAAL